MVKPAQDIAELAVIVDAVGASAAVVFGLARA
jgi:hypothetical protein